MNVPTSQHPNESRNKIYSLNDERGQQCLPRRSTTTRYQIPYHWPSFGSNMVKKSASFRDRRLLCRRSIEIPRKPTGVRNDCLIKVFPGPGPLSSNGVREIRYSICEATYPSFIVLTLPTDARRREDSRGYFYLQEGAKASQVPRHVFHSVESHSGTPVLVVIIVVNNAY